MSSEGTVSVVGSEVMPLEYGGMDSESSPSPSSSERTVEERKEREIVEKVEEEIPSNIMEVKGDVDRCYDPDLGIVSEVREYESELGSSDSLKGLVGNCKLLHHVLIRPARVNESVLSTPRSLDAHFGGKSEKGWYYFGPRTSSKENMSLFTAGPSSIKGWKEKFFFVDDTEWSRREAEVEYLSAWKAKKVKQNEYKLNEDEVEEVRKLVREEGDLVDILYLTSSKAIEAAELYGPNSLSESEMEGFLNAARGLAIPKKPRKKSKTSKPIRRSNEEVSEEVEPLRRKKKKVIESEVRGDEVVEFIPWPSPTEVEPEVREREEAEVQGPGKGKELIPPPLFQKSLFEAKNITWVKWFLTATLPEVDRRQARDEAVSQVGALVVRHTLESASWVNALAQKYAESVKDRASLDALSTKLIFKERKRKICEDKLEAQDKYIENMNKGVAELKKNVNLLVHNGMEEHIGNFLNSSTFGSIVNLYRLPTTILVFIDYRKKVKAQYPEVDVTTVTFGDQEEGVKEDGESLSTDFRPQIKLRWERDAEGCTIFPPAFDAELVAVEEEEEVRDAEVENQADPTEVQLPEVHPVSSDEVQLAPHEAEVPPLPTGDEPPQPPPPVEEQPPFLVE
ncbi:hypothetical protein SLEP1_g4597 [Rubroshorea leprosula]|uniref:Uncharacterized protein n=1 Tax=Rubroshorea leprosula TaxID=152421 RepID=A0AAV5HVM4_9ROSI|nr:hypothetical protein SLEP1_g4597 [Rubroshorea leprosula]